MKHRLLLFLIGLLGCCSSCIQTSPSYPHSMRMAIACMSESPDDALVWLQGMTDSLEGLPEETRMYYHLLTLQAEDEQYLIQTDDSLVNRIVAFYETTDEEDKLAEAYYLKGKVYIDMNDAPQALKAFQQALDIPTDNLKRKARIYDAMRPLFSDQGLYNDAIQTCHRLMEIYQQQGNTQEMNALQRSMARMYGQQGATDSAVHYYREASRTALEAKDSATYYGMMAECAGLLYKTEKTPETITILKQAEQRNDLLDKSYIHALLAEVYQDRQMEDSAAYYHQKVIESGNIEKAYHSYIGLHEWEKQKGNYAKALEYMERALNSRNLLQTISQREALAQISSLYNYQHISDENADLKLNRERQKNVILALVLSLTCLTFTCFAFITYQQRRSRKALEREQKLKQLAEERYAMSQMAIRDNERKMEELTKQLAKAQAENDHRMYGSLEMEMKKLQLQNEEIRLSKHEQQQRIVSFMNSDLYKQIERASRNDTILLTEEDWEKIEKGIDFMYPTFNKHLNDVFPDISLQVKKMCWLSKIGILPTGIAHILKRSRQAITNTRARLNKIIADSSLPEETFDDFIANLA